MMYNGGFQSYYPSNEGPVNQQYNPNGYNHDSFHRTNTYMPPSPYQNPGFEYNNARACYVYNPLSRNIVSTVNAYICNFMYNLGDLTDTADGNSLVSTLNQNNLYNYRVGAYWGPGKEPTSPATVSSTLLKEGYGDESQHLITNENITRFANALYTGTIYAPVSPTNISNGSFSNEYSIPDSIRNQLNSSVVSFLRNTVFRSGGIGSNWTWYSSVTGNPSDPQYYLINPFETQSFKLNGQVSISGTGGYKTTY